MNLPQTAGCNFWEMMNIIYRQMLFSLYDRLSSLNPQATARARRTEKKVKETQRTRSSAFRFRWFISNSTATKVNSSPPNLMGLDANFYQLILLTAAQKEKKI